MKVPIASNSFTISWSVIPAILPGWCMQSSFIITYYANYSNLFPQFARPSQCILLMLECDFTIIFELIIGFSTNTAHES